MFNARINFQAGDKPKFKLNKEYNSKKEQKHES